MPTFIYCTEINPFQTKSSLDFYWIASLNLYALPCFVNKEIAGEGEGKRRNTAAPICYLIWVTYRHSCTAVAADSEWLWCYRMRLRESSCWSTRPPCLIFTSVGNVVAARRLFTDRPLGREEEGRYLSPAQGRWKIDSTAAVAFQSEAYPRSFH